jgi:hypothetical protein
MVLEQKLFDDTAFIHKGFCFDRTFFGEVDFR